jgi:hypothetical protein
MERIAEALDSAAPDLETILAQARDLIVSRLAAAPSEGER